MDTWVRNAIFGLVLALAGCSSKPTIKLTWTEYKDPDGQFTVSMPTTPVVKKEQTESPIGKEELGSYTATIDPARFIVDYKQYPPEYVQEQQAQLLQNAIRSDRRSGNLSMGETASTIGKYSAVDYEVQVQNTQPARILKGRLVLVDNRLYDIVVESPPGTVAPADVTKFLESFKPAGS
jgi:hypothetical protein